MSKKLICLTSFVLVLAVTGTASADQRTITVPDAGFDDHILNNPGDYVYIGDGSYTGAWKSHSGYGGAWVDYGYWAADGDLPALSGNNKVYGYEPSETSEDYIYQILDETFIEGKTYTLSVWVGQAWSGYENGWGLYFTGEDYTNNLIEASGSAPVGSWQQVSLVYTATAADAGNRIGIKMQGAAYVTFEDVTLSYDAGAEPGVTIHVDPNSDIAAANAAAKAGDTIEFAEGTYYITSQIVVKDGVTYKGAGRGLTIIDSNDTTRAFVAWGDRSYNEGNENPNDSGPKDWVIEGMTIQNCVADTNNRYSFTGSAFDMNDVFAENDTDGSGGLNPEEANADSGGIRLPGPDGEEGTEDDDLHRFEHMDTDGNGELSQEELLAQMAISEEEFGDESRDGGALFCGNQAVGTIANCEFLSNHTPLDGDDGGAIFIGGGSAVTITACGLEGNHTEDDGGAIFIGGEAVVTITDCGLEGNYTGDDGGAITLGGLSVVTVNDCRFVDNYAASADGVKLDDLDGDGGHIKLQGDSASAITPGTTLIAYRCDFLNGKSEDDGGAIMSGAVGTIIRLDACWFEGNTAADDGTVLFIGNVSSSELTVTNCVFANNISAGASDKMCHVKRNSKFINCTFVGNNQDDLALIQNTANIIGTDGEGVDDETADVTQVVNCIFANNVVGNGDDVLKSRNNDFTIAATNCLFFGNTLQNGNDADNTQRPAEEVGSILADPLLDVLFVPGVGSPAIDTGIDPATVGVTITTDLSGNPRPQSAAYDIGAYEVEAAPPAE